MLDLSGLKAMYEAIPLERRKKLTTMLPELNRLRSYCETKGWVKSDIAQTTITVIRKTEQVKEMMKIVEELGLSNIKFVDEKLKAKEGEKEKVLTNLHCKLCGGLLYDDGDFLECKKCRIVTSVKFRSSFK
jgi:ribosomal protein S17